MDNRFLAYLELKQDFLFDKIKKTKIPYYIDESIKYGERKAKELEGQGIEDIVKQNGIAVEVEEGDGEFFKVKFRARFEFDPKGKNTIFIYSSSVREFADICGISEKKAYDIHIAHELFHFFEFNENIIVSQELDPIVNFKFLGFRSYSHIKRCSEIGAHAFVSEILDLPFFPNYFDYIYLINKGRLSQQKFNEWVSEFVSGQY